MAGLSSSSVTLQDKQSKTLSEGNTFGWLDKLSSGKCKCTRKWQTRWFILDQNQLRYYYTPNDKDAIRVLDLKECSECCFDESMGKMNCFRVAFPWRVFHFYAATPSDADDWVRKIQTKIGVLKNVYR